MGEKLLKDYKGMTVVKSWEEDINGRIIKDTVMYHFEDDDGDMVDCYLTLSDCHAGIREYLEQ